MKINEDFTNRSKLNDIGRFFITDFVMKMAKSLPKGTSVLDAGAGECAYKKYFAHCDYKSVDVAIGEPKWNYANLDYVAPLDNLPIENETFDVILCTQVLEHLQKPIASLKELCRVLKSDGYLFLTAPMAHMEHQIPYDYFRYTSYGLKYILSEAGFRETKVEPIGGMFLRWAYELPRLFTFFQAASTKKKRRDLRSVLLYPFSLSLFILIRYFQMIFIVIDGFDKNKNDPFGWKVIARK
jgi:ubiquinone/menaquinone biosynthesis C-methylase UbiE